MARRMTDMAARLTDAVLPAVPVRQWVLSLPLEIRYHLAYDGPLIGAFLALVPPPRLNLVRYHGILEQ